MKGVPRLVKRIDNLLERIANRVLRWRALPFARTKTMRRLQGNPIRRVLVICYGNIFRSPFVAAFLKRELTALVEVRSAGFYPRAGRPPPDSHVLMSKRHGIVLHNHRSAVATPNDLDWADTIVLMDSANWLALKRMGVAPEKLVWLGTLDEGDVEIPDPFGLPEPQARRILERLHACADCLVAHIKLSVGATRD